MKRSGDELDERKKLILRAVVDAHIKGGGPVGSKYLTENKQIALSSATIRNEMAELEELGYLEQPHTSAGRIPSELGYRFYVNSLMRSYRLSANELKQLNNLMKEKISELDKLLEGASKLIAMLTNYTALSLKPRQKSAVITGFRTLYLEPQAFLLVIITGSGIVKTRNIHTAFAVSEDVLGRLEDGLNACLCGIPMEDVTLPVIMELTKRLSDCEQLVNPIIKTIYDTMNELDSGDLRYEGVNLLLQYPEYADADKIKELFGMLERKDEIMNLVSASDNDGTQVIIGAESPVTVVPNSTLIFRKIRSDGHIIGAIGVLGPCRMDYSRVITTVEHLANNIAELTGGEQNEPPPEINKPPDGGNTQ